MILFTCKNEPETREGYPCKAFRWSFQIEPTSIGFIHQHQHQNGEWDDSHTAVYIAYLDRPFKLGSDHIYYDGPHCIYQLGFLRLMRGNWKCKECIDFGQ